MDDATRLTEEAQRRLGDATKPSGDLAQQVSDAVKVQDDQSRQAMAAAAAPPLSPTPSLPPIDPPAYRSPPANGVTDDCSGEFHKWLLKWVNEFDVGLGAEHEVGIRLGSFGQAVVFHLTALGHWNPSLICFSGTTDDGNPVELIQHVSQISFLLMGLKRKDLSQPKRPVEFHAVRAERAAGSQG